MISISIAFPLDDDRCLRRECPHCKKEFKLQPTDAELEDLASRSAQNFMLNQGDSPRDSDGDEAEEETQAFCPYCGQQASLDAWWTEEQLAYVHRHFENIIAGIMNKELIRPMKRMFSGGGSGPIKTTFKGDEMPQREPWISPEPNDMTLLELPCCHRRAKVLDDWKGNVHCFFCGFPHRDWQKLIVSPSGG